MKITIPGTLPTMNEIIKVSKAHPMAYASMKKKYTDLVAWSAKGLPQVQRADFIITWYCKDKRKDKDNVATGAKFLLDGLVKAGVIKNDGWKEVGNIEHRFEVDRENPRIEMEIKEVEHVL